MENPEDLSEQISITSFPANDDSHQPPAILQTLEHARSLADQQQEDQAIEEIAALFDHISPDEPLTLKALYAALADCYQKRAARQVQSSAEIAQRPDPILQAAIDKAPYVNMGLSVRGFILQAKGFEDPAPQTPTSCMACGEKLFGDFYRIHYSTDDKDLDLVVCPDCSQKHEQEQALQVSSVAPVLTQAIRDLIYALEMDPQNSAAAQTLETARSLASDLGIQVPATSGRRPIASGTVNAQSETTLPYSSIPVPAQPAYWASVDSPVAPFLAKPPRKTIFQRPLFWIVLFLFVILAAGGWVWTQFPDIFHQVTGLVTAQFQTATSLPAAETEATSDSPLSNLSQIFSHSVEGCFSRTTNIRSGPGKTYDILGYYDPGACVTLTGKSADGAWYQIDAADASVENQSAWVYANNVTIDPSAGSVDDLPVVDYP